MPLFEHHVDLVHARGHCDDLARFSSGEAAVDLHHGARLDLQPQAAEALARPCGQQRLELRADGRLEAVDGALAALAGDALAVEPQLQLDDHALTLAVDAAQLEQHRARARQRLDQRARAVVGALLRGALLPRRAFADAEARHLLEGALGRALQALHRGVGDPVRVEHGGHEGLRVRAEGEEQTEREKAEHSRAVYHLPLRPAGRPQAG